MWIPFPMEESTREFFLYSGGCLLLLTYAAVAYATFSLKPEERRQHIVCVVICLVNVIPPFLTLMYDKIDRWEKVINASCIVAYCLCLVREIFTNKSRSTFKVLVGAIIAELVLSGFILQYVSTTTAEYCAALSLLTAIIPPFGCYLFPWKFSYLDTYITFVGSVAICLSIPSDASELTINLTWATALMGEMYSLYAIFTQLYYRFVGAAHRKVDDILPDRISTEAQYGSDTAKGIHDVTDKMPSRKRGRRGCEYDRFDP